MLTKNKRTTVILSCIGATLVIYCVVIVIFNIVLQNKVRQKLQELSPFLHVSFSSIHSGVLSSSLSINNLNIVYKPDSNNDQHRHLFYFPAVSFTGVNFFKLLFNKEFSVNKIRFEKGAVKLDQFLLNKKDSAHSNIFGQIPFNSLSINRFELAQTNVWLDSDQGNYLLLKESASLDEINIDHLNKPFSLINFHCRSIENSLSKLTYSIPGAHHIVQLEKLVFNSEKGILQLDSLKIIPEDNAREPGKKIEGHSNQIEATISNITVLKLDVVQLFNNEFIAEEVIVNETNAHIFSNGRKLTELLPASYHEEIPVEVRINTLKIKHSSIVYKGFSKENSKKILNFYFPKQFDVLTIGLKMPAKIIKKLRTLF